jgi:hypothetical protein
MKNPSRHYPIVYLEWHDAFANANWMDGDEFADWDRPEDMKIHEIGWLIKKDKKRIVTAHRFNEASGQYGMFQMIPTTWCKITVLAKPKRFPLAD